VVKVASLAEIMAAVDDAVVYLEAEDSTLQEAVDVACDHARIVSDSDRRIVRHALTLRLERTAERRRAG
jgi:hypothetical protein